MKPFSAQQSIAVSSQAVPHFSSRRFARAMALMIITGLCAAVLTGRSNFSSYEDRLVDIAARQSLPRDVYAAAETAGSSQVKAMLLDVAADRELVLKLQWMLTKYGADGRRVLETYGSDPMLFAILRRHGENVVPVIIFFMDHDIVTLRARYGIRRLLDRWRPPADDRDTYGPEVRGLHAIEKIDADGHHFLGQFAIKDNVAYWNQTDRVLKSVEGFLAGGVRNLETKHDIGAPIKFTDIAWAGADIVAVAGVAKTLKLVKEAMAVSGTAAKEVSIASRTTLFGKRVLQGSRLGQGAIKLGAKLGTAYLVAMHPGLLTSLFVEMGSWLGWPTWISAALGWWVTLIVLSLVLLPLAGALVILIPVLRSLSHGAMWLWPFGKAHSKGS